MSLKVPKFKEFQVFFLWSSVTHSTCNDPSELMFYTVFITFLLFPVFTVVGNMSMALLEVSVSGNKSINNISLILKAIKP